MNRRSLLPKSPLKSRSDLRRALTRASTAAALALLFGSSLAQAANTQYNVKNGSTDLTATATYTTGGTAGTGAGGTAAVTGPTVTSDVLFDSGVAYSPAAFTLGSSQTFGSLNDLSTTTLTISNTGGAAADTLTLGGTGDLGDGVPGSSAADLFFVGTGATLNITGGTGNAALGLVLGQSGNFDIAGTSTISSVISDGGNAFGLTKTGAGTLTLSGANTYTGATSVNAGTLTLTGSLSSTVLNLNGGTFTYTGAANATQSFTTTNLNGFVTVNNTVATDTLALGNIVRTVPGTVNFATTTGAITTTTGNTAGILGPWATIGTGTALSYAVSNGGSAAITAYASGTPLTSAGGGTAGTTNFTLGNASVTLGATSPVTANTLQVLNTDVTAITLANGGNNVTLNGILNSGGAGGGLTISGTGQLLAGATKEIDITNNANGTTISSVIANSTAGASSLVFNSVGGGGLTLGAANIYTGNTYINSGGVTLGNNATAAGTGAIFLGSLGNSSTAFLITNNTSQNYANPITVEPGGRRYITTTVGGTPTYSGGITLVGGATLEVGPNSTTGINLSGGATGTGNLIFGPPISARSPATINFSGSSPISITGTISDNDNVAGGGGSNTGSVNVSAPIQGLTAVLQNSGSAQFVLTGTNTYTGGTNITAGYLDDQVAAALTPNSTTTVGPLGTLVLGVGSAAAFTSADVDSLLANTLAHVSLSSTSGVGLDTTPGNFTYASNTTTTRFLTKIGSNSLILTGTDNFLNNIVVSAGTLQLGNGTTDGSFGITQAIIDNAALAFNTATAESYGGTIGGSGTLTKTGAGTLTLSGANFFTGNTTVSAGTLDLSSTQALQNSALQTGGTGLVFDQSVASHSFVIGGLNGGTTLALVDNAATPNPVALTLHPSGTATYNSALTGAGSLTVAGVGTQVLGGTNTYTGGTTVSLGTLKLDFSQTGAPTSNILYNGVTQTSTQSLTMGGVGAATNSDGIPGANLLVTGKASTTNTQTFNGLTVNPGVSNITITPGTSGNVQLNFTNGLTHNAGGVINFTDTQSATNFISLGDGVSVGTLNDATGIIGGYATVNGTAYASVNASGQVVPYTYLVANQVGTAGAIADAGTGTGTNVQLTGAAGTETLSGTTNGATNINTLTNSGTGAQIVNVASGSKLRLGVNGGILQSSGQDLTIGTAAGTGTLTAGGNTNGTAGEISLISRNSSKVTINSVIANNNTNTGATNSTGGGAVTVTIGETGTGANTFFNLATANTYSGGTYLLGSRVQASTTTSYGTGPVYVLPGAQAYLNAAGTYANTFNIGGIGANESGFNFAIRFVNNGTTNISGGVNLLGDAVIAGNGTNAITGNLSGTGSLNIFGGTTFTLGSASSTDTITGNLSLNGFVPGTTNNGGGNTLKLGGAAALPNGTSSGNVIINGGAVTAGTNVTLDVNGFSASTNGLISTGANVASSVITNSGASATLTIGDNNANAVFGGTIADGGTGKTLSIVKAGTGTQIFSGANSYIGSTTVSGGTLAAYGAGTNKALGGTTSIAINNGGTLLLGTADQVNTAAPIRMGTTAAQTPASTTGTLSAAAGASQGMAATVTGGTVSGTMTTGGTVTGTTAAGLGALTLNNTATLTFSGAGTTLVFGTFTPNGNVLTITGYTNTGALTAGNSGTASDDRLVFSGDQSANLNNFDFGSGPGAGVGEVALDGGFYEITEAAVPEPATYLGGLLLVVGAAWRLRRRGGLRVRG